MSKLEELIAASTPGELKTEGNYLQDVDGQDIANCFYADDGAPERDPKANARRIALSWNRFPQAVELLRQAIGHLDQLAMPDAHAERVEQQARALLATIEKEAAL